MKLKAFLCLSACWVATACGPSLPTDYTDSKTLPKIYPDYVDVTIPVNIAPLTFQLDEKADAMVARYSAGDEEVVCEDQMRPSLSQWHSLVAKAAGGGHHR